MARRGLLVLACLHTSIAIGVSALAAPASQPVQATQSVEPAVLLADHRADTAIREGAARQLLPLRTESARQPIQHALEDTSDPAGQLAAARAIASAASPAIDYLVPLRLMMGTDRALTEAAAQALASYKDNPESLRLLVNFASSRQQREADRLIVIRAIGTTSYKGAAEFLVSLLLRDDDTLRIRNGAADALVDMTGRIELGQDPKRWQDWWSQNAAMSDAQWRQELQASQASRYAQVKLQYDQLTGELSNILTRAYENTPADQQPALMLAYLRSSNAEIRRVGATIVHNEAMAARPIPQEARDLLRSMVSDSSRAVRIAVASALLSTNDPAALDALLQQLARETDPTVRAALAPPIASIGDLRAVPALRQLLSDSSTATAAAGASALRELGPIMRDKDPKLAHQVALDLRAALDRQSGPGALAFREAVAEALIPLRDPEMTPTFYQLLNERSSTRIRWAALRALGELHDPKSADTIARHLEDRESGVRLEAVRSLGKTSATEHAEELYHRMDPVEETDASVRDEAWAVLQTTFAALSLDQFPGWIQRFANDPPHRAIVLKALIDRSETKQNAAQLAAAQQQLGKALMELNQPLDAATAFKASLSYYSTNGPNEMLVEQLSEQYLTALLHGGDFAGATQFGSTLLSTRSSYQQTVGVLFRNEARTLVDQKKMADARSVIAAARAISPALASRYLDDLAAIEKQLRPATAPTQAAQ